MTNIFISHSGQDRPLAFMLAEKLKQRKYNVFLDFSHKFGIPGGVSWEETLLDALRRTDALLLCSTPASFASQWCFAEVMIARYAQKPIVPLLFSGDINNIWGFLNSKIQYIDFTNDPDTAYERLIVTFKHLKVLP